MSRRSFHGLLVSVSLVALARPALGQPLPLGSEFQVNTTIGIRDVGPDVAVDAAGNFVVVWTSNVNNNLDCRGQRFDRSANPLGGEFLVNTTTAGWQEHPVVAAAADGAFVVVWEDRSPDDLLGQRYDASGNALGGEFLVNTATTRHAHFPDVASAADGSFVVVWESGSGSYAPSVISARRYDVSGNPLGGEFRVNTTPLPVIIGTFGRPSIASAMHGDFVVVWPSYGATYSGILGQRFDSAGLPLGGEFRVNTPTDERHADPSVALDADGNFVVAWTRRSETTRVADILAQRYDASGNRLGSELRVNGDVSRYPEYPSVAMDAAGDFLVAWRSPPLLGGGPPWEIRGQAFDATGMPFGGEFRVNSTGGSQFTVSVASHSAGDVAATWGGTGGVRGQRYAGPGIHLEADGSCPGPVTVSLLQAPPLSEVGIVAAANLNGFTKGGTLCAGTRLEIGEPFGLPPLWVVVDENGGGSAMLELLAGRCYLEALALADCTTSGAVRVP